MEKCSIDVSEKTTADEEIAIRQGMLDPGNKVAEQGRFAKLYPFVAFVIIGTVQLIGWNSFLNSIYVVNDVIFPGEASISHISTITATYATVNFVCTCFCIAFTEYLVRPSVTYLGLVITALTAALYSVATHIEYDSAFHLLHFVGALMGLASSLIGCSAFGYANYFPSNYGGALSAGLGVAGVATFIVWTLGRYVFFDSEVAEGARGANWLLNGFSIVLCICALVLSYRFLNEPWVKEIVQTKKKMKQEEKYQVEVAEQQPHEETILETFKGVSLIGFLFFYTMFITLFCFPTLGPSNFKIPVVNQGVLIGMFQIGDLIGRYTPNVVPWLLLKKNALTLAVFARTLFAAIFLIIYGLPEETVFLGSLAFQIIIMLLLSITNGWLITCCFIRLPDFVESDIAKARCGSIALLLILLGITVGQWLGYAVTVSWV